MSICYITQHDCISSPQLQNGLYHGTHPISEFIGWIRIHNWSVLQYQHSDKYFLKQTGPNYELFLVIQFFYQSVEFISHVFMAHFSYRSQINDRQTAFTSLFTTHTWLVTDACQPHMYLKDLLIRIMVHSQWKVQRKSLHIIWTLAVQNPYCEKKEPSTCFMRVSQVAWPLHHNGALYLVPT